MNKEAIPMATTTAPKICRAARVSFKKR